MDSLLGNASDPGANGESILPVRHTSSTHINPSWSSSWDLYCIFFLMKYLWFFCKGFHGYPRIPSWEVEKWAVWKLGVSERVSWLAPKACLIVCVRPWPWLCCSVCPVGSWQHPFSLISCWFCWECRVLGKPLWAIMGSMFLQPVRGKCEGRRMPTWLMLIFIAFKSTLFA